MKTVFATGLGALSSVVCLVAASACSSDPAPNPGAGGAGGATGGANTGGGVAGGAGTAGAGESSGGGASSGGASSGGASSGGGGSGGGGIDPGLCPPAAGTPTFTQVAQILEMNCGSKCHAGGAGQEHMLNLSSSDSAALHMRLTTPLQTDLCFGQKPVKGGLASTSVLVKVIKAELSDPCVLPRMPAGCAEDNSCLSDADIATIEGWVNAGACKN